MAALTPPDYCNPIPNGPFYSPQTWQICGNYLDYSVGFGICISPEGDMTNWSCGKGVSALVAGQGIQVTALSLDTYEVANTGIVAISPGEGITSTGGQCPTLSMAITGASPGGVFLHPSITVDETGRITEIHHRPRTIQCDVINTCADLLVAQESQIATALPVGTDGYVLAADSTCALGMRWENPVDLPYVRRACLPSKGYLVTGSATADTPIALAPLNNNLLVSCSACPNGVRWGADGLAGSSANYTQYHTQPYGTTCTVTVASNFNACGCNYYMIQLAGDVASIDSNGGVGCWRFNVGGSTSPYVRWTSCPSPFGNEEWKPANLAWLFQNNGATGSALSLEITFTYSQLIPATLGACLNVSAFGF